MGILQVSLLGGLLALDATSVGQFMASRPLVAGALTGWLLGQPAVGVAVGAILELYLLVSFPTGGSRFPEGATATVVAVAAVGTGSAGALALGVAAGLVWGQLAGASINVLRHLNARLVPGPEQAAPTSRRVALAHLGAVFLDFVRGSVVTLTGVLLARSAVGTLGAYWPISFEATMGLLLVGGSVSVGILLRDLGGFRRRKAAFVTGLTLAVIGAGLL